MCGIGGTWEISIPPSQFSCKIKNALKKTLVKKVYQSKVSQKP